MIIWWYMMIYDISTISHSEIGVVFTNYGAPPCASYLSDFRQNLWWIILRHLNVAVARVDSFLHPTRPTRRRSLVANIGEEQFPDLRDWPLDSIWCFMLHEELRFPWFPWRWVAFKAQTLGGDWIASPKLMDRQVRQNRSWRLMMFIEEI